MPASSRTQHRCGGSRAPSSCSTRGPVSFNDRTCSPPCPQTGCCPPCPQLKKYLCDRRHGCSEGLLITFDKTLPNGLSATRVNRVAAPERPLTSWPLLGQPCFCSQPLHHLESDPFAVGVMLGLCQGYGVELGQD